MIFPSFSIKWRLSEVRVYTKLCPLGFYELFVTIKMTCARKDGLSETYTWWEQLKTNIAFYSSTETHIPSFSQNKRQCRNTTFQICLKILFEFHVVLPQQIQLIVSFSVWWQHGDALQLKKDRQSGFCWQPKRLFHLLFSIHIFAITVVSVYSSQWPPSRCFHHEGHILEMYYPSQ